MAARTDAMDVDEGEGSVERLVLQYLHTKGYKNAEAALKAEAKVSSADELAGALHKESEGTLLNLLKFHNADEASPMRYNESYSAYKKWAQDSLDVYKDDLLALLFPLCVHSYLDLVERGYQIEAKKFLEAHRIGFSPQQSSELDVLTVMNGQQIKETELVRNLRDHKMELSISRFAFELLLSFLHERKYLLLLSIINVRLSVKVSHGVPTRASGRPFVQHVLHGESDDKKSAIESAEVKWGLTPKQKTLAGNEVKFDADAKQPSADVPLPVLSKTAEEQALDEIRKRVQLNADSQPSIALYTVFNSYSSLNRLAINAQGSLIAGAFTSSVIRLWDLLRDESTLSTWAEEYTGQRREITELVGHSASVFALSFSPDSHYLLSGGADTTVRLWSMATRACAVVYRGHSRAVWDVQFAPMGGYFATASADRTALLFVTSQTQPVRVFAGHLSEVNCVRFHPNCNYVLTGSTDKCVRMWDIHSGETVRIFAGHAAPVYALAVSPNGRYVASADKEVFLWDLKTNKLVAKLQGHVGAIWSLDFSAEGSLLASASLDKSVRLWDIERIVADLEHLESVLVPQALAVFPTKNTPVFNVQFTRANLLFAGGRYDREKGEANGEQKDDDDDEAMIDEH